ncbi:hypothetical protein AQ802_18260 [Burkholderia pseudomallei]|nr:hypothetical protein SZ31_23650 [Burkholderia pseudomallei]KJR91648.1 hypothetical protein VP95_24455 [Burkholderia pseudomallei]KYZ79490.1 hypothetical protein PTBPS01_01065 [Burkholderia pseudomallei]OAB03570.1 hypothetical protein AQ853_06360 [Burkholderia pseudomallei]OAB09018.1 hypothetical protein AQ841_01820 [Burkholderia pseudomallei]
MPPRGRESRAERAVGGPVRAADGACMPPRARRGRCRMLGQRAGNARRMSRLWALASSRFRVSAFE